MKYLLPVLIIFFVILSSCIPKGEELLYYDEVFKNVRVKRDIVYGKVIDYKGREIELKLDFYEPEKDEREKRPLIIWIHGGGFKSGDKSNSKIVELCNYFAKRGYVTASINYRLRKFPRLDLENTIKDAVSDARKTVDFFRTNREKYRIDVNHIAIGGSSAGGVISLHLAYTDGWDKDGIFAVISMWGALLDMDEIKKTDPPAILIHGTEDDVVSYEKSLELKDKLDELGIYCELHSIKGEGHAPWRYIDKIEEWVRDFLFKLLSS